MLNSEVSKLNSLGKNLRAHDYPTHSTSLDPWEIESTREVEIRTNNTSTPGADRIIAYYPK